MSNVVPLNGEADWLDDLLGPEPKPVVKRSPFQNWTDNDIKNQPEIGFLIGNSKKPILGECSLWQIYGKKKSAKTLFTMEAAFCIAFGLNFNGLDTKQGQVIYDIAEGGIKRNYKRFEALYLKHEVQMRAKGFTSLADAREKTNNLILLDQAIALASDRPKDPYSTKAFLDAMAEQGVTNPVLVVLDTWARALWASGGHDSDQQIVGPSVQACDLIRQKLGGCALIMIAHVGAQGTQAKGLTDPAGAVDGGLSCVKDGDGFANSVFKFTTVDQRHGEEGFVMRAKLSIPDGADSVVLDFDDLVVASSTVARLPQSVRGWLTALRTIAANIEDKTVTMEDWLAEGRRTNLVISSKGGEASPNSYWRARDRAAKALEEIGAVSLSADKLRVTLTLERVEQKEAEADFNVGDDQDVL
jgi:hypothetical protein